MTKIIVTGVDSSQTALNAAHKAAELAQGSGAELHVFSAYRTSAGDSIWSAKAAGTSISTSPAYEKLTSSQAAAAAQTAQAVAGVLQEAYPDLTIKAAAVEGTPAEVLLKQAQALDADTIVVGNKRVQGVTRVLGSIALKVATEAKCDLHIVNTTHN